LNTTDPGACERCGGHHPGQPHDAAFEQHLQQVAAFAAHHQTFTAQEAQAKQAYAQAVLARLKAQDAAK